MKPTFYLIVYILCCVIVTGCTTFEEIDDEALTTDETILSAKQIFEISKATKVINTLALQEVLKNEKFAGNLFTSEGDVEIRSSVCPIISPDPIDYDPEIQTDYLLEFDQCAFSDQLIGVGGTPIIIGNVNISLKGQLGHSGCEFRVYGENLSVGAVKYLNYDITQTHFRQITSDTCVKRDIIDFATKIDELIFSVKGLTEFGETDDILSVFSSSNGRTRYRDFQCNTDINDFITLIDDKIVIQADTIISGFIDGDREISRNIFTDVAAEFDLICPCPISQSFNVVRGGVTSLTCFDFDSDVCDDDLTCLTTTIPLDCRF